MMRHITLSLLTIIVTIVSLNATSNLPVVYAASASGSQACTGLNQIDSTQGCGTSSASGTSTVNSMVNKIIGTLSWVVGIATVIMIILAGFQFITSGGDSNGVTKAKTALFYAMIGLLIVALAQFLVHFVLSNVTA